jgi:hypothetical protein
MASLAQAADGGLLALAEPFNQAHGLAIVSLALKYKIPTNVFAPQMMKAAGSYRTRSIFPTCSLAQRSTSIESSRAKSQPICPSRHLPNSS